MSLAIGPACLHAVAEMRAAWDWLSEQVIPGPTDAPSERHISVTQAAIEAREAARDRAARHLPPPGERDPRVPSGAVRYLAVPPPSTTGPHPDAARVPPIHGRQEVAWRLWRAAQTLHQAVHGKPVQRYARDPRQRPAGTPCPACRRTTSCRCDADDVEVAAALHIITTHLRGDVLEGPLRQLLGALERANRDARRIAGAAETLLVLKAACPVCDGRDLVADCSSPDKDEWSIRCRNRLCRCQGSGCRCGSAIRYAGKQHRWATLQWHDLAARLGVTYTQLYDDAVRRRSTLRSGHVGGGRRS